MYRQITHPDGHGEQAAPGHPRGHDLAERCVPVVHKVHVAGGDDAQQAPPDFPRVGDAGAGEAAGSLGGGVGCVWGVSGRGQGSERG